jgi:hypothetical protein
MHALALVVPSRVYRARRRETRSTATAAGAGTPRGLTTSSGGLEQCDAEKALARLGLAVGVEAQRSALAAAVARAEAAGLVSVDQFAGALGADATLLTGGTTAPNGKRNGHRSQPDADSTPSAGLLQGARANL